jgi:hypothetical protein
MVEDLEIFQFFLYGPKYKKLIISNILLQLTKNCGFQVSITFFGVAFKNWPVEI